MRVPRSVFLLVAVLVLAVAGFAGVAVGQRDRSAAAADAVAGAAAAALPAVPASEPTVTGSPTPAPTRTARAKAKAKAKARPSPSASAKKRPRVTVKAAAPAPAAGTGRIRTGKTYTGRATFYDADGGGNCSYPPSGDLMVGAMNHQDYADSQACGARLAVTGPKGNTIAVTVVDQCPECPPGAIDLSAQAFAKLAAPKAGMITIHWRLTSPALSGPVSYVYKSGSTRYWCAIQVRNHRNPVRTLEVMVSGQWKSLPRADYNYFLSASGAGCGGRIRVTDTTGHRLTDSGVAVAPGRVQKGHAQFPGS